MPDVHVSCNLCGADDAEVICTRARWGERMRNVACRRCGFVYADPRLDRDALDRFYRSRIYPQYVGPDGRFTRRLIDSSIKQAGETYRYFTGRAGVEMSGKRVLEIGCGLGDFLALARDEGADVLGVEMDGLYANFAEEERKLRVLRQHIERQTFDRQFDAIAMFHVLEHLEDPGAMLATLRSLLTPDGQLLIEVPNLMGPWNVPPGEFFRIEHLSNFSPNTLRELLRRSGFLVIHQDRDPFLLRVLARPAVPQPPDLQSLGSEYRAVRAHLFKWRVRGQLLRPYYFLRRALPARQRSEPT
jgi:2-polyprenyl-3-methyl-5-hydroxy-6-metoxy-1,4-benzoquinol methylase